MMNRLMALLVLGFACDFAAAQANSHARPADSAQPLVADPADALRAAGGSLLRAAAASSQDPKQAKLESVSFFAVPAPEPRVLKKHDLVTIIVREESQSKSEGTTDLQREAALEAKIEEFVKLSLRNLEVEGGALGTVPPSIKLGGKRDFKGEATVDRSDSLTLRVTAEVVDVKPNGTLVLQARSRIRTDDEEQVFILSGVCRVDDVTPDNTVLSTQLFDKEILKTHTGAVRDGTKRGWLTKLLDALNPF